MLKVTVLQENCKYYGYLQGNSKKYVGCFKNSLIKGDKKMLSIFQMKRKRKLNWGATVAQQSTVRKKRSWVHLPAQAKKRKLTCHCFAFNAGACTDRAGSINYFAFCKQVAGS